MALRWVGIVLVVSGCSDASSDASYEDVSSERQAVESSYDRPVAAALVVNGGAGNKGWVFACDSSNRLQRNIRTGTTWAGWEVFDTACVSVPSAAKWFNGTIDSVAVYARYSDGHLWQLYWPDATNDPGTAYWADLSALVGFSAITGDVVVADTNDSDGFVSVAVKKASNNELWTFDYFNGSWSTRKVLSSGTTAIRTTNTVSAHSGKFGGMSYLTGRGLTSTDDTTGWIARRQFTSYSTSFSKWSAGDYGAGTPTVNRIIPDHGEFPYVVARFGSSLKSASIATGPGWFTYQGCVVNGSPRTATHALTVDREGIGYSRGGNTTSTNDLVFFENDGSCHSVGGAMYSAATLFEYATSGYFRSAIYLGTSGRVIFYDPINDVHVHLTGLTLP